MRFSLPPPFNFPKVEERSVCRNPGSALALLEGMLAGLARLDIASSPEVREILSGLLRDSFVFSVSRFFELS